jgi:hypothetical protein
VIGIILIGSRDVRSKDDEVRSKNWHWAKNKKSSSEFSTRLSSLSPSPALENIGVVFSNIHLRLSYVLV